MQTILTVLHLFLAIGLIGLILIQHGKGADMGAAFGSGASSTVFGARGSGNFLSRSTAVLATVFFLTSMTLAYFAAQVGEPEGLMDAVDQVPVAPAVEVGGEGMVDVPPPASAIGDGSDVPPPAAVEVAPRGVESVPAAPEAVTPGAVPDVADPVAPVPAPQQQEVPAAQ